MNMLSLIGFYGSGAKETAHIMLEHNMMQFMASDAHRLKSYELMEEAIDYSRSLMGEKQFKRIMSHNPMVAIGGKGQIECYPTEYIKKKKKFWQR